MVFWPCFSRCYEIWAGRVKRAITCLRCNGGSASFRECQNLDHMDPAGQWKDQYIAHADPRGAAVHAAPVDPDMAGLGHRLSDRAGGREPQEP